MPAFVLTVDSARTIPVSVADNFILNILLFPSWLILFWSVLYN
jgi:hypothetical protein